MFSVDVKHHVYLLRHSHGTAVLVRSLEREKDWLVTYLVPLPHMPTLMMTSLTQRKGLASDVFGTLDTHADPFDDVTDTDCRLGTKRQHS